jgi:SAM-dependent methyltransferase
MAFGIEDYDPIRPGMERSAATVVPEIVRLIRPEKVVDVGCGQGVWLAEFARHGCTIRGFDGHDGSRLDISRDQYTQVDFESVRQLDIGEGFDLAVCLEVAEHLPASRADWLVGTLCGTAPVVLFSAAIPGQGGSNHINEQWPDYWAYRFARDGYRVSGALRWKWWDRVPAEIEPWYAQNMLLCVHHDELADRPELDPLFGSEGTIPYPVVHPSYWVAR